MSLINREELLKHQRTYYDYNGEKIGVVRVTDIVEAPDAGITWVPMKERRPSKPGYYLLTVLEDLVGPKPTPACDEWCMMASGTYRFDFYDDDEVMAWAEFPKLYREETCLKK